MHAGGCRNPARISQSNFCPVNTSCIRCDSAHFKPRASSVSGCCARSVAFSGCLQKERTSKAVVLMYYGTSKAAEMRKILGAFYLAAGARLAAENESQAHDEKTSRTYELRLMSLEQFAQQNGDDAVLFEPSKRPFLAATIQTYMRKFVGFMLLCLYGGCDFFAKKK